MKIARRVLMLLEEYSLDRLRKSSEPLNDLERETVMKAKAVWHHGPKGAESPAVSKAEIDGDVIYFTYTHRAYQTAKTLNGAIKCYHDFIKETA